MVSLAVSLEHTLLLIEQTKVLRDALTVVCASSQALQAASRKARANARALRGVSRYMLRDKPR